MVLEEDDWILTLPLGGLHNAYNAMAALAAAGVLGIRHDDALRALARFHPRFGRAEEFEHDSRRLWLGLIKNPAGTGAISRSVAADPDVGAVVIAVNDLHADGRDVSWIWDAEFEGLVEAGIPLVASGRRAEDVALRLKYAGHDGTPTEHEPLRAIEAASARCEPGRVVAVLATYTAMLEARQRLLGSRVARVEDRGPGDQAA
jgi:UDP-N-acetylmuramyl tripeptide synthase